MATYRASDGYIAADLLRYARDHREAAYRLFESAPEFFDSASYLAHLSVELLLKSILLHTSGEFNNAHSLSDLRRSVEQSGVDLQLSIEDEEQLKLLDSAWDIRYPHPKAPKSAGHSHRVALRQLWFTIVPAIPSGLYEDFVSRPVNLKGGRVFMVRPATERHSESDHS